LRRLVTGGLIFIDGLTLILSGFVALFIRFEGLVEARYFNDWIHFMPFMIVTGLIVFNFFGLYKRLWRYAGMRELLTIVFAVTVSSVIFSLGMYLVLPSFPRSVYILSWGFNVAVVGLSRLMVRVFYHHYRPQNKQRTRVLIVGAGDAGAMIARELQQRYYNTKQLIGFIDDDRSKHNRILFGVKVFGNRKSIKQIVDNYNIQEIIIALPSAGGKQLRRIIYECKKTNCIVKTVPGLYELIDGKVSVQQVRNVDLEDLLRREPVKLDIARIAGYLTGKTVLVTGAGGSIGSELCRQIAALSPKSLILLGKGENSIYEIHRELLGKYPGLQIEPVIADVRDNERIDRIFAHHKPQVIFHAAAHKHVPLMELQPDEAVRNNIFGTKIIAEAAHRFSAEKFILISTDKAVNPTSVMGVTKRVAELVIQNLNRNSKTKYAAVRFGNVLGSRGSVVPLFRQQIAAGGPVTITHPDMKRYFMTIPEAVQLVLQAGSMVQGGEVFVLDMGEPVKIIDMVYDLIKLSGLEPELDIKIKYTGLRPGEKLYEELLTAEEGTTATHHQKIYQANIKEVDAEKLQWGLMAFQNAESVEEIVVILARLVPTYHSSNKDFEKIMSGYRLGEHAETVFQEVYEQTAATSKP
jgi:FlaA1/EpsC-like NDP-sugar epimerase